tara:strand:+ start:2382 stop:3353 length:972 start_codon:yes stop_codon:yes gene_type:complete
MKDKLKKISDEIMNNIKKCKDLSDKLDNFQSSVIRSGDMISELITGSMFKSDSDKAEANKIVNKIISALRVVQFNGIRELDSEKLIEKLKIGNDYKAHDTWAANFDLLKEYMTEFGHTNFGHKYHRYKGVNLEKWVQEQRKVLINPLGDNQKKNLLLDISIPEEKLPLPIIHDSYNSLINNTVFMWRSHDASWMNYFKELKKYFLQYGDCLVPASYKTKSNMQLGTWVLRQRQEYIKHTLSKEQYMAVFSSFDTSDPTARRDPYKLAYVDKIILLAHLGFNFITDIKSVFDDPLSFKILNMQIARIPDIRKMLSDRQEFVNDV